MNSTLTERAIQLALDKDWEQAVAVNQKILESNPTDLKALLRLGKALVHQKEYKTASNIFEKVLQQDPINKIAKKNLKELVKKVKSKVLA